MNESDAFIALSAMNGREVNGERVQVNRPLPKPYDVAGKNIKNAPKGK